MTWATRQITVAQTAIVLLGASLDRTAYEISTPGTNSIFIGPVPGVSATDGHRLALSSFVQYTKSMSHDVALPVYAISTAGNNVVTVREDLAD